MSAVPAGRRPRPAPSTPVGTAAPSAAAERLAGLVGGVLLYAACAALSLWHVRLLSRPIIETRELVVLGALGLAPGLAAALAPRGRVRLLVAAIGLLALVAVVFGRARGRWPGWPLLGDDGYLQVVAGDVRDGLGEWVQTLLPYEVSVHPTIHLVVQLATVLLLAWVGLAVLVLREPVSAILAVFIPFATTSAVFRVEHEVVRTALAVGLALVLLAALRGRRPAPAAFGWAAVLVVAAVVLAGAPGVAKGAFLDWRSWSDIPREGRGVEFMWQPSYGPLQRPESRTTVARVRSDRSSYWRANVLTRFNGLRWEESPVGADAVRGVGAVVGSAASGAPWLGGDVEEAEITVSNLGFKDPDLLVPANGVPLSVTGVSRRAGGISLDVARGVATTDRDWPVGTEYRVRYAIVDPTPKQLNEAGDEYPDAIREDGLALSLLEDVEFPLFGVEGREDTVQSLFDFQFYDPRVRDWREAYGTARDVVADAKTPYEAVVALEEWFQQGTYDETADYSAAPNGPLPAFLLTPNRPGYCQMDAGAMAVLLRMLGIPARVAQGFTAGRADRERKRWTLTDAEAHAWVEVFFPGHGWVPFEPTPSRRLASAASGTSPRFAAGATDIAATSAALGALLARIGSSGGIGEGPGGPAGAPDPQPRRRPRRRRGRERRRRTPPRHLRRPRGRAARRRPARRAARRRQASPAPPRAPRGRPGAARHPRPPRPRRLAARPGHARASRTAHDGGARRARAPRLRRGRVGLGDGPRPRPLRPAGRRGAERRRAGARRGGRRQVGDPPRPAPRRAHPGCARSAQPAPASDGGLTGAPRGRAGRCDGARNAAGAALGAGAAPR